MRKFKVDIFVGGSAVEGSDSLTGWGLRATAGLKVSCQHKSRDKQATIMNNGPSSLYEGGSKYEEIVLNIFNPMPFYFR